MSFSVFIPLSFLTLVFVFSWAARKVRNLGTTRTLSFFLAPKSLNWFLVAFSAGTTANTGFIVTSAIAMGFGLGLYSLLFPLSFFLGDLFYWQFFARRINHLASVNNSRTIPEFITAKITGSTKALKVFISVCIIISAVMYTIAQWNAAGKIFNGFYNLSATYCISIFFLIVLAYCLIGGFFSSVYADIVQGLFMILLATITTLYCIHQIPNFKDQLVGLFKDFVVNFKFFSENGVVFILGWALASIGFSFSQPHILDKIIAAKDESNVSKARYVYMFFVQYTWIGMTFLGVLIKLLYTDIKTIEPERALATFISFNSNEVLKGFVVSGVFATIASTAASLMISISNYLASDIYIESPFLKKINNRVTLTFVGLITIIPSLLLVNSKVFDLTIFAVSLGAVLAPCMLIKIFNFKHNSLSMIVCLTLACCVTVLFKYFGLSQNILYDIPVGTALGLLGNFIAVKLSS